MALVNPFEKRSKSAAFSDRPRPDDASRSSAVSRFRFSPTDLPRWLFLGLLLFAPWAYGSTREWAVEALTLGLGVVLTLWLAGLIVSTIVRRRWSRQTPPSGAVAVAAMVDDRRELGERASDDDDRGPSSPRNPPTPTTGRRLLSPGMLVCGGLLLLQGWWMTLNAGSVFDPDYLRFVPLRGWLSPGMVGSVEGALSLAWMWRATTLLGAAWFVAADLGQRPEWVLRLWKTCALAGASVALLGLVQRASGATWMFWGEPPEPWGRVNTFFGPYLYHANAGAFFNLTLPLVLGLFVRSLGQSSRQMSARLAQFGWGGASLILGMAVAVNTSRAAQALGALLFAAVLLGPGRGLLRTARGTLADRGAVGVVLLAVVLVALAAIAWTSGLDRPFHRWESFREQFPKDGRWLAPQAAWVGIRENVGAFGLGPGVFQVVFPYFTGSFGERLQGVWGHLHEDYVQTVLEWGWVGAALWAWWFFGGILSGARRAFGRASHPQHRLWLPRQRALLPLVVLALASIALHALVDFPLQIASLQLYVATYLGLCWGSGNWGRAEDVRQAA